MMHKKRLLIWIGCVLLFAQVVPGQVKDSSYGSLPAMDSTTKYSDSNVVLLSANNSKPLSYQEKLQELLTGNKSVNSSLASVSNLQHERHPHSTDMFFYTLLVLFLLFGVLKMIYSRYLQNLFRVFFNTSLRQSQLTDQLLQARLPSLLFNLLFVLIGGFYLYLLLKSSGYLQGALDFRLLFLCILAVLTVYFAKYMVLKFTGWISGYSGEAETYIFIIFLINKIMAIILLPFIAIMAFADYELVGVFTMCSWIVILLMLLLRFLKSYAVLQNKIKVQRFHFFLYIIAIELLPLLLIYKSAGKILVNIL